MRRRYLPVSVLLAMLNIRAAAVVMEREQPLSVVAEEKDGKAVIRIIGYINEWSSASSVDVGVQIDALNAAGYKEATVYINTKGGQTWEANEIVNALRRFNGQLNGVGGAMVFSAGTYIACKLDSFKVHSNTQWMWHRPKATFEGTHDDIESALKLLKATEQDYLKVYAAKTGKSEKELEAEWLKGDQWLMGQEIVDAGFADGLIGEEVPVSEADVKVLAAIGAPVVPVATVKEVVTKTQTKNQIDMKIDPTKLGLAATATEAEVNARLDELSREAEEAKRLKEESAKKAEEERQAQVKAILDAGQQAGKFDTGTRAELEAMMLESESGFERGKKLVQAMHTLPDVEGSLTAGSPESRKDWKLKDWQEKDPAGLEAKAEKDPKWFENLVEASYK